MDVEPSARIIQTKNGRKANGFAGSHNFLQKCNKTFAGLLMVQRARKVRAGCVSFLPANIKINIGRTRHNRLPVGVFLETHVLGGKGGVEVLQTLETNDHIALPDGDTGLHRRLVQGGRTQCAKRCWNTDIRIGRAKEALGSKKLTNPLKRLFNA